jgi:hypothetical protein
MNNAAANNHALRIRLPDLVLGKSVARLRPMVNQDNNNQGVINSMRLKKTGSRGI